MKCWSCQKDISADTKFCPHCEAPAMPEPSSEDQAAFESLLKTLAPDILEEIEDAFDKSASGEEFVNRLLVGNCPQCAGSKTSDCENDPEIEDSCIGRCFDCGQLWCLDCGELFKDAASAEHDCPAWEGIDFDDPDLDEADL